MIFGLAILITIGGVLILPASVLGGLIVMFVGYRVFKLAGPGSEDVFVGLLMLAGAAGVALEVARWVNDRFHLI